MVSPTSAGKVWFITGSSSGFGRVLTEEVLKHGDRVVATLRKPADLDDLRGNYPSTQLLVLKVDVTNKQDIQDAFNAAKNAFHQVDIIFNNAGYGILGEIEGTPEETARAMFDVNFWGAANVTIEGVKFMRDVNKPAGGRILQVTSTSGIEALAGVGYYGARCHALEGLSDALAKELNPAWNIKITIIEPGGFETRASKAGSLVVVPQHPAYTFEGSPSVALRGWLEGRARGDPRKAAKVIYDFAGRENDDDEPRRLPLGKDAVDFLRGKSVSLASDVDKTEKWSEDLELDPET
ncbi:NAD P-binding protein [Gloeophyllum trabeum ATCC 11539]|uniref:NAD P-binding protein n=1 Tax=Gloeophyllum trabeum (strain ATCC 11539 / FP-39264 / Madison 617) TaxID=670483 RepID=S7RNC0_GLOTA|nr:NAD P-binding protein [Gloeophyllum trabeum ATCC 11539]EPQ54259.1 NAD P-binding protein [Gloeophyllum trabeum ATCC 11539]